MLFAALLLWLSPARADDSGGAFSELLSSDRGRVEKAVEVIAARRDTAAVVVLTALQAGTLRIDAQGQPFVAQSDGTYEAALGGDGKPAPPLGTPLLDNRLRRQLEPAAAGLRLSAADRQIRLAAAEELKKHRNDELAPVIRQALAREQDASIRGLLALALAQVDLESSDVKRRVAALAAIEAAADPAFKADVERVLAKNDQGAFKEPNEQVRRAANSALSAINVRAFWFGLVGHLFYGVSLGSVLLLAAMGLAITFGLMRVINMAHGELLMFGAYTTYVVQKLFQANAPAYADWYLPCAVPAAFVVCAAVGMLLEFTVLRRLYGRPLETLLATWGISLILIQTVRLTFGAQNVTVANPSWLSGGVELLPGFVLTYSRLAVILFSGCVIAFVWLMLQKSALGLHVRAVTQNREMAASMGISTRRVDLLTFGIGSGVAGLGGVALSQLGNVGPELGQAYIVDSFMVVVLGGVGKLAGTLAGALGLGIVNKLLEPAAGAVLGKIAILGFIILFIQRRPQGIFALKGRAAEVT